MKSAVDPYDGLIDYTEFDEDALLDSLSIPGWLFCDNHWVSGLKTASKK